MKNAKDYLESLQRIMEQNAPDYMDGNSIEDYDEWNAYYIKWYEEHPNPDYYRIHVDADRVLCDLLRDLGYNDVVDYFEKMPKQYE